MGSDDEERGGAPRGVAAPLNRAHAIVVVLLGVSLGFALGVYLVFQPEEAHSAAPGTVSAGGTGTIGGIDSGTDYQPPKPTPMVDPPEWLKIQKLYAQGLFRILSGADFEFLPLFLNSMLSVKPFGIHRDVQPVCYDDKTCDLLTDAGFTGVVKDDFIRETADFLIHQLECYNDRSTAEIDAAIRGFSWILLHSQLLGNNIGFFTFAPDVCFIRNPILDYFSHTEDIVAAVQIEDKHSTDNGQKYIEDFPYLIRLNMGAALVKAQADVRSFFAKMHGDVFLHLCEKNFEEGSLNRVLYAEGLRLHLTEDYFHGRVQDTEVRTIPMSSYQTSCVTDMFPADAVEKRHIVHPLCLDTVFEKINFLKNNHCWHLRDGWMDVPLTGDLDEYLNAIDNRHGKQSHGN